DRDHTAHAQTDGLRLPRDLDEVTAERMHRELRFGIAERRFGPAAAADEAQVGPAEQIAELHALGGTVRLDEDPAALYREILSPPLLERRAGGGRRDAHQGRDRVVGR